MADDLPSSDDIAFYREHGSWISGQIVPHELLDEVRDLLEAHQLRPDDERLPSSVGHSDWSAERGSGLRNNEFISIQLPGARRLTLMPLIGQIAAALAGTDSLRLFEDQALYKPPGDTAGVIGWHTDAAYATTCTSDNLITAWIPLDDVSEENGTIVAVDGSHLWAGTQDMRHFSVLDLDRLEEFVGPGRPPMRLMTVEMRKGQVEFHHGQLLHASAANLSSRPRIALAVTLQPTDNEYRDAYDVNGELVVLPINRLCRRTPDGKPDYHDPEVFPVVWPVPATPRYRRSR